MNKGTGRYSKYLRPLTIIFDVSIINLLYFFLLKNKFSSNYDFLIISLFWIICTISTSFYEVFRFTKLIQIADKSIKQFTFFSIFLFAYIGFFSKEISNIELIKYIVSCFVLIVSIKYIIFNSLKWFRKHYKGNQRRVIIVGNDQRSNQLAYFFSNEKDYGYELINHFKSDELVFEVISFCKKNNIDEIYFSLEHASNEELDEYIDYTVDYFKTLKFIPTKTEIISNSSDFHYYGLIPILPSRLFPLQNQLNRFVKRSFDLIVSTLVIIFILSWLVPLIGILIKLESKGPIFFNQIRNGLFYKEFNCFKFRSMYVNNEANTIQATKNDKRVTKIGKFLRKTSLDEMPQFFNVFLGDMSVCGPRPHMVSMTNHYEKIVTKFRLRHFIKPGITGMAQTHGCRGEIETQRDIVNRVKYDVFYLENWSLLLDIKIIYLTVKNAILGDKKAY